MLSHVYYLVVNAYNIFHLLMLSLNHTILFSSFSPVILFLKTLLNQHNLDEPFTGGLGSYKLYVLVSYHIEQYLLEGGTDEPAGVLLSFFYRYMDIATECRKHWKKNMPDIRKVPLSINVPIVGKDCAVADLSNVFRLDDCKVLFRICWSKLWQICCYHTSEIAKRGVKPLSILSSVLNIDRLRKQRNEKRLWVVQQLVALHGALEASKVPPMMPKPTTFLTKRKTDGNTVSFNNKKPKRRRLHNHDLLRKELVAGYNVQVPV